MSGFHSIKNQLPELGIGLGLRRELSNETFAHSLEIDWLEIVPENYMDLGGRARERLESALDTFPIVPHGINLSIGSADELNFAYLNSLNKLLSLIETPWWSDHLCFTSIEGVYMQDLLPLPFTREAVDHIVRRARFVQDFTGRPFLLENISFYMQMPGCEMPETEFITQIVEQADCGLLLDVNNVYVNSVNHKFDPFEYVDSLPLDRVVQIHVAGHKRIGDYVIDTHGSSVIEPVYELLRHVLSRTQVKAILLERDQNYPDFEELLSELRYLRKIAEGCGQFSFLPKRDSAGPALNVMMEDTSLARGRECRVLSA